MPASPSASAAPSCDSYGSTEGGATVQRTPDTPRGALGRAPEDTVVVDPATGDECAVARFDAEGRLINAEEAIGELVSKTGAAGFEGYWDNDDAERARLRNGWYWTGDLAYRDDQGFFYFAGRSDDWLRVDGENFAAAPVSRILERFPDVVLAVVYAVPDPVTGDQVMAALQLRPGAVFDPDAFATFLAAQPDLGTKWAPRFVRVSERLPDDGDVQGPHPGAAGGALALPRSRLVVPRPLPGLRLPAARALRRRSPRRSGGRTLTSHHIVREVMARIGGGPRHGRRPRRSRPARAAVRPR